MANYSHCKLTVLLILIAISVAAVRGMKKTSNKSKKFVCNDSTFASWKKEKLDKLDKMLMSDKITDKEREQLTMFKEQLSEVNNCQQLNAKLKELNSQAPSASDLKSEKQM